MNSGSSDPNEHFARDNGTLMHSNSEKMLATNSQTELTMSKTVARLRASVPSSSAIINDPILMADQLADALCPPLSIDEAMLPAPVIDGLIDEELSDERDVEDADSGVSALRLKLATARLNDGQYDHISPSLTSSADGLPLTIWSFDKVRGADAASQSTRSLICSGCLVVPVFGGDPLNSLLVLTRKRSRSLKIWNERSRRCAIVRVQHKPPRRHRRTKQVLTKSFRKPGPQRT